MLPGITIGDCGPKNGVNGIDNGFIMLDDVKIPYENLLNKFGWIDEMGVYCSKVADKNKRFGVHMSGFSSGRGLISFKVNNLGLHALTVVLRYACSRKQFENDKKNDENIIIDYPITKIRIIPHLATVLLQIAGG